VRAALLGWLVCLAAFAAAAVGCQPSAGTQAAAPPGVTMQKLTVTSKSFPSHGPIPVDYTCDGADKSPQLTWSAAPAGTKAFALIVDDPDAPGGDFIHWVAFNLRGDATSLPESADVAELGGTSGTNGFKRPGYNGPCPPKMELHAYAFRIFALDAPLTLGADATADQLQAAMNGHVLGSGTLFGTFSH
jgi:Raf kinase inhibitor-like YbhB/YbcL family protein